ncbi:YP015 protein, partial [Amia calva]|nr:YP015 protein [Amia calva]
VQLRNVQIKRISGQKESSPPNLKELRVALERSPLQFVFQSGKIPEICPQEGEAMWALNIKRAILSMLQSSHTGEAQEAVMETDVFGTCLTNYDSRGPVLVKTRDLRQCSQHWLTDTWLRSVPLPQSTEQLVDSTVQCVQRYRDRAMEEVNCTETIHLVPLSSPSGTVQAESHSILRLLRTLNAVSISPGAPELVFSSGLQFEKEAGAGDGARAVRPEEAAGTVRRLCAAKMEVQQAEQFISLVFQLRALTPDTLNELWQEASYKCRDDWQPLVDALPACGSEACVALMTQIILSSEVEEERISSFLSSLGFIPRPSPRMIRAVTTLIEGPEPKPCALMGVSSLVHLFCSMSQLSCGSVTEVQAVIAILQERLGDNCRVGNPRQLGQRLIVLRAVGNAGLAAASLSATLTRCAQDTSGPLELRLAALHAFRRIPCSADRSGVLQLYHTLQEDAEVRIAAYQQAMLCPSPELLHSVRDTLRTEPSSQVGAFVWSHLTQIQETQDPLKQALRESLPDDIIDKDFEVESWKYSSYMDATMATGYGAANVEGAMVFSPSSFVPRSAMANMTVHVLGQAVNLLEINIRAENVEPLVKTLFSPQPDNSGEEEDGNDSEESPLREKRRSEAENEGPPVRPPNKRGKKQGCQSSGSSRVRQVRAKFTDRLPQDNKVHCSLGIKILGNELIFLTCDDISTQVKQFSLSLAGMAVKLLKGQEVQYNRRLALATEEFVLPSLSGLPIRLALNMSASISLRVKGSADFKNWAHFLLSGYIKPSAQVAVSARMGVEGVCGRAGVEWVMVARTSTSLDGGVRLQEGQDLKVSLNTPEDTMDIIVFSSRIYSLNGEGRKELAGPKPRIERTACTHPEWSRLIGWQLCSQISYPLPSAGLSAPVFVPKSGPVSLSIRLVKLDKGLRQYLLEAGYSLVPQRGSRLPSQASLHLFMGTPQSELHRDLTVDVRFNSITQRLSISLSHPQKTLLLHGEIDEVKSKRSGKVELLVDNADLYYIKGMTDLQTSYTEQRFLAHLEAKLTKDSRPAVLSANLTRGPGKKMSVSVTLKNLLKDTASISVQLERRLEEGQRQYSVESELLLPGLLGAQVFGLLQHGGPLWTSALRLRYGLRGDARILRHECSVAQKLRSELGPEQTYLLAGEHELHCSDITVFNHKVQLRHEESPAHIQSALDLSYGKHWDEINNQRRLLLSQTFRNRSQEALTSYLLEFSLQFPERQLSYSTQLQHSHLRQRSSESSTHLKVNYNGRMPLVAGLHWKDSSKANLWRWEGSFNMDTPWLYLYTAHKLSQPQRRAYQLSTEITARKWINIRSLVLEGFCRARGREREGRLHLYTPTVTYFKVTGSGEVGERVVMASGLVSSLWTPSLQGKLSLQDSGHTKALQLALSCARQELNITASLTNLEQKLKKKQLLLKMVLTEPKSPQIELEVVGSLEELIRDRDLYRKQGTLRLRHPLRQLPQSLLLQETFTVDRRKGQYVLVSRAVLNGNEETRHTLTLGYRPGSPSVCSALIHPYSAETIPHDLELCVHVQNNHTQQEVEGRVRINHKDRLTLKGSFQNRTHTAGLGLLFQVNVTHLLEHQVSPIVNLEAKLYSSPRNATGFDYRATGKAVINNLEECQFTVQLNGSSNQIGLNTFFTHPYHSRIPKDFKAHATAARHGESNVNGSLHVEYNGEEKATFEADIFNTHEKNNRIVGLKVSLRQKLLPAIEDLYVQLTGKASNVKLSALSAVQLGSGSLQAQLSGTLTHGEGSLSGSLQHTITSLSSLPPSLGLAGSLRRTLQLSQGELSVNVSKTVYGLQLLHHNSEGREYTWQDPRPPRCQDGWMDRLCVRAGEQSLCVSLNSSMGREKRGLHGQLSHSFAQLLTAGLPSDSRVHVSYLPGSHNHSLAMTLALLWGELSLETQLRRGQELQEPPRWQLFSRLQHNSEGLRERGVPTSVGAEGHCQVEVGGLSAGLAISVEEQQRLDVSLDARSSDGNAQLAMSLRHHMGALAQALPSELQVNCTGETTADQISGLCSGTVAGQPLEVRAFFMRVTWVQVREAGRQRRTAVTVVGEAKTNVFRGSVGVEHKQDSLHSQASVLLLKNKAELSWSLQHHWTALQRRSVPGRMTLHGPFPTQFSVNGSMVTSRCGAQYQTWVQSGEERGQLSLTVSCASRLLLNATLRHSLPLLRALRVPPINTIFLSAQHSTAVINVTLGQCGVRVSAGANASFDTDETQTGWDASWTNHCSLLQRAGLPLSLATSGSLSLRHCQTTLSASLRVEEELLTLQLGTSCEPRHSVSGALRHSFSQLSQRGLPSDISLTLSAPSRPSRQGTLLLKAGQCRVRASGDLRPGNRSQWVWTADTECPLLKGISLPAHSQFNGSLLLDSCSADFLTELWLDGQSALLELKLGCSPLLRLDGVLRHRLHTLQGVQEERRLVVTAIREQQGFNTSLQLTMDSCELRAGAGLHLHSTVQGTIVLDNNCTALQEMGSPLKVEGSGSLAITKEDLHSQLSITVDEIKLQALLTLRAVGNKQDVEAQLNHSVPVVLRAGVPAIFALAGTSHWAAGAYNRTLQCSLGSTQTELAWTEAKTFTLHSQLGDRHAILGVYVKDTLTGSDITGGFKHSWVWLQERGVPRAMEVHCSMQGSTPNVQYWAQVMVDGEELLSSALNASLTARRLALLVSHSLSSQHLLAMGLPHSMETTFTTLSLGGIPASQVLPLCYGVTKLQQYLSFFSSKGLHVKALHNIPELLHYLPFQLDAMSKLNQSGSRVQGLARLSLGRGDLWLQAGLTLTPAGYWEVLELNHSLPQLKFFPRHIDIQTSYERGNRTQRLEHRALWVGQELRLRALLHLNENFLLPSVQMSQPLSSLPHQSRLDVLLEQSVHRWMNSALLGWSGQDGEQQVSGLCSRSSRDEGLESKVSVRHPFNLPLSQLDLYSISHTGGQEHQYQALVSWNEGLPVNVTLSLQGQRDTNSSRGQACVSLSPGQLQAVLPVVEVHACGRLLRQGQGYNQALELSWGSKKITESLHYQSRGVGIHSLQLEAGVENVFPSSCPTQRLLARLETNCRDRLEHHFQLGLCSPNPSWTMSGLHRVGLGRELLYSRTSLAVSGRPLHSSFTLTLTNNSARALRNFSLSTELLAGGAVLELLGSVSSSNVGLGLLLQASLDRTERVLLRTGLEGHCLQATASYSDGTVAEEALAMALCVERSYSITLEAQRHVGGARQGNLATISLSTANQSLTLSAQGCAENLRAAEVRLSTLGSKMRTRLLDRIRSLQHHLLDFRSHMQHSTVLQELSEHPLHLARGLEALLLRVEAVGWGEWRQGALRRALTGGLPLCSARLQEVSQQIQDELKRPLSTLAEAYQDVWGRRPGAEWQEKVTAWAAKLGEMLPAALEDVQLKAPLRALLGTVNTVMDMAGQQAVQWAEARLARALAGVRRRLATLYRYSPSRCEVVVQVPLPGGWWARQGGAGVTELLLEEAVLRPLRILTSLTSLSPAAELYRLQRRVMDSPFQHQALLAAGRFVVSFDGRLFELPSRCALLLAHDLVQGSFTVLLSPEAGEQRSLLVDMNNTIISILPGGQVEVDCQAVNIPFSTNGVTVKKDAHIVEVSNQKGASVSCDLQYSVCSVTLSGWQHGVSAGLMGTNDNEAGNEMTLPDWSKTDNVTHFIHSWQLRPQCRSDLRKLQPCPTPVDSQPSCRALFASQASPLGHCFRVVDPGQFLELCQSSRCDSPPHSAPCSLAAAYVHLCRRNYVPLDLPPQCGKLVFQLLAPDPHHTHTHTQSNACLYPYLSSHSCRKINTIHYFFCGILK